MNSTNNSYNFTTHSKRAVLDMDLKILEEISIYDREQRKKLQEAMENPDQYQEEEKRIHEESRQIYFEILARHNWGNMGS